jgi:hypothetical protein
MDLISFQPLPSHSSLGDLVHNHTLLEEPMEEALTPDAAFAQVLDQHLQIHFCTTNTGGAIAFLLSLFHISAIASTREQDLLACLRASSSKIGKKIGKKIA